MAGTGSSQGVSRRALKGRVRQWLTQLRERQDKLAKDRRCKSTTEQSLANGSGPE